MCAVVHHHWMTVSHVCSSRRSLVFSKNKFNISLVVLLLALCIFFLIHRTQASHLFLRAFLFPFRSARIFSAICKALSLALNPDDRFKALTGKGAAAAAAAAVATDSGVCIEAEHSVDNGCVLLMLAARSSSFYNRLLLWPSH